MLDAIKALSGTPEIPQGCENTASIGALWEGIPLKSLFEAIRLKPEAIILIFRSTDD